MITVEPPQEGERRVVVKRPGQVGIVQVAYIRPGALDPDFIALEVLSTILSDGVNSRLYQALVETQAAASVGSTNHALRDPFVMLFQASIAPDSTHRKTEDALKAALDEVATNGVTEQEVRRAQKLIEVRVIRSRDGTFNLASNLGEAIASASWEWWHGYIDTMNKVTAADVKRVAAKYLVPDRATIGWFVPIEPAARQAAATKLPGRQPVPANASAAPLPDAEPIHPSCRAGRRRRGAVRKADAAPGLQERHDAGGRREPRRADDRAAGDDPGGHADSARGKARAGAADRRHARPRNQDEGQARDRRGARRRGRAARVHGTFLDASVTGRAFRAMPNCCSKRWRIN